MHAAIRLNVSQHVVESEYFLVDIPELLRIKARHIAEERVVALQTATVSGGVDKDVYERYLRQISEPLRDVIVTEPEFDRNGLGRLRQRLDGRGAKP